MFFNTPALLGFLALAAAPIIIHLLNRRRYIRVDWAPMQVLRQTIRSNRRRVRLEQWILLALRTLAVAALIAAIAGPMTAGTNLSVFDVRGRASRVVVLDDSLGMGLRSDGSSAFERAANALATLLDRVGPDDEVTVLTTSAPGRPLARQARLESPDELIARLKEAGPADAGNAWSAAFSAADTALRESTYPTREVTLITDLGRHGWDESVTRTASAWAADDVMLRVLTVDRDAPGGLALMSLTPRDPVLLADVDTAILAEVTNSGADAAEGETMTVNVDGTERTVALPDVPAGESVRVPVAATFAEAGPHRVSVRLPSDSLPADGFGYRSLDVRPELDVVIVDGQPGLGPFEGESDFLRLVLTAGYSRINVRTLLPEDWESQPLLTADVVLLANVDRLPAPRVTELERLVRAGTGLMIFVGSNVSPSVYNDLLGGPGGLLPARLSEPTEVDASAAGLLLADVAGSPLEDLGKLRPGLLDRVLPKLLMPAGVPEDSDARVLARWNDGLQSPAAVYQTYGRGGVLLWTVSADRDWSDWPTDRSYVLAVRSAATALAGRTGEDRNLTAGELIRVPLAADRRPTEVLIRRGTEPPQPADITGEGETLAAVFADTARAGFYTAEWEEPAAGTRRRTFAVSPDVADTLGGRLDEEELGRLLGPLSVDVIPWSGDVDASPGSSELWPWLIALLIFLLLCESALAAWIDRKRADTLRASRMTP